MYACTFFGHRDCPESIKPLLSREIERLIREKGVTLFFVGDSGNFDRLVRQVLMELENRFAIIYNVVLAYFPNDRDDAFYEKMDYDHTVLANEFETVPRNFTNVVFGVISLCFVGFFPVFPMIW